MTWQPIETAPKDGEYILIGMHFGHRFYVQSSFWIASEWAGWDYRKPTHWMPLPEPPEEE